MLDELYVSVDIESDGPIPGDNNLLSIGAAICTDSNGGVPTQTFSINLAPLETAHRDASTMRFWDRNPEAWAALQVDQVDPKAAMSLFDIWLRGRGSAPVYVAYPAPFDFGFTHWYFHHFLGHDPFGFSALDLKTYAMKLLGLSFRGTTKKTMPREWFQRLARHDHVAVNDAVEQGQLFYEMQEYERNLPATY